jgi:hypothetical protein
MHLFLIIFCNIFTSPCNERLLSEIFSYLKRPVSHPFQIQDAPVYLEASYEDADPTLYLKFDKFVTAPMVKLKCS